MRLLRVAVRFVALAFATAVASLPALSVFLLTVGCAPGVSARLGSRLGVLWSRAALAIVGVQRRIDGRPRGEVFLVAANHLSYLDIWLLGSLYPSVFVAKREIASWPLFGWIARAAGTLFVDRESARDVVRVSREMAASFERGISVTLFAEGQATRGESVLPFMPPLFEAAARRGIPCYAASLTYETPGVSEPPSHTVCWWGGQSFFQHIFKLLGMPRVEAVLRFSEAPLRGADRKELARKLHEEVRQRFVPVRQSPYRGAARRTAS